MVHVFAIFGLAALCAGWVLLQRWMAKHHPELPGEEKRLRGCGFCSKAAEGCEEEGSCDGPDGQASGPIPIARLHGRR